MWGAWRARWLLALWWSRNSVWSQNVQFFFPGAYTSPRLARSSPPPAPAQHTLSLLCSMWRSCLCCPSCLQPWAAMRGEAEAVAFILVSRSACTSHFPYTKNSFSASLNSSSNNQNSWCIIEHTIRSTDWLACLATLGKDDGLMLSTV